LIEEFLNLKRIDYTLNPNLIIKKDVAHQLNWTITKSLLLSLPFVGATLAIAAIAYNYFGTANINTDLMRLVFIGLFGLTVSHMLLINRWHSHAQPRAR
jgi:hypothetical protein